MRVGVTPEETAVLVGWRKRSDNHVLVRMKAEAVLHASRGVDAGTIAETVERTERTVQERPAEWQATRMRRVPAGHAGNQDAAEPTRARKQEPKAVLARPPSRSGVRAGFRDVPALREVVRILFDVEHQADSSYRLLPRLCGPSPEPPDPFDEHRDETATTRRAAEATTRVKSLSGQGRKAHTTDEARPEHEAWTRRMQPPKGQRTRAVREPAEDVPVLPRRPPPRPAEQSRRTRPSRTGTPSRRSSHRTCSNEKPRQRRSRSSRTTPAPHHAKALTGLHQPGQLLERITPVFLPPYAPDHNPAEHVRNTAKNNTATIQHETPEETLGASASHVTGHTVDHDSEHLPPRETRNDPAP